MPFLEIPLRVNSPVRLADVPLGRFLGLGLLNTIGHVIISGILIGGWFGYGMAAGGFNGQRYIGPSNFFLGLFNVWNAGYVYGWTPVKEHLVPAYPPYEEPPSGDSPEPYQKYHPYLMETVRIHKIRTTCDVLAFVGWASLSGFGMTFMYLRLHQRPETEKRV